MLQINWNRWASPLDKDLPRGKTNNIAYGTIYYLFFSTSLLLPFRFTKETARFKDDLDVMKYICKEFWTALYKKQIDNLRTNHQVETYQGGRHEAVIKI